MAIPKTDLVYKDTAESKRTGYFFGGKEVIATKRRGRPPKYHKNPLFFSQDRKEEAVTLYCVYGDVVEVSRLTEVPEATLREWKKEPWWIEIQKQVFVEQNEGLASRISTTLDTTLTALADRLENGDSYTTKGGEMKRKPISAKVLSEVFTTLAHQRQVTRGEPTNIIARQGIDDRLLKLQEAFLRFTAAKEVEGEVIEG